MKVRRTFTDEFKSKIVEMIAAGAAQALKFSLENLALNTIKAYES
jgi:transposase-like protein